MQGELTGRLVKAAGFVRSHLETTAPSEKEFQHRWKHTLRVTSYGRQIAEAEGADIELSLAGCLLHDVAKYETPVNADHGRLSAEVSRPVLLEAGFSPEETETICHAVAVHVDGVAGYEHPETIESKVVTDADNVDSVYPTLLERLRNRLVALERYYERGDVLETETGNRLFRGELSRQISFFRDLLATRPPADE